MAEAQNNRRADEKRFVDVSTEPDKILPPLPQTSESESIPTLLDAIKSSEHLVEDLRKKTEEALSKCKNSKDKLSRDQSAALYLYSMQWPEGKHPFYFLFNRALRHEDRTKLIPYHNYLKLFMSALNKLPSKEQQVWRGVIGDVTSIYSPGTTHVWWGASSCTDQLHVTGTFLNHTQKRTLFHIKCYEGKTIKDYSEFPNESETILPPGTYLKVVSSLLMSSDAYIVELEQVPPDPKLVGEAASVASGSSQKKDNNLYLIWSDPTVNKSSENKKTQEKLRDIFNNSFKTFENGDQCENFINLDKDHQLVLIVSGQIGRDLVPKIHNLSQVKAVVVQSTDLVEEIEKENQNENKKTQQPFTEDPGYETKPLIPLQEALQPVHDFIPDLDKLICLTMYHCNYPNEHGLTKDESAAIMIYTMETAEPEYSVYRQLNQALYSEDRDKVKIWFSYLKLFMTGLNKLPSLRCTAWRGMKLDSSKHYPKDMTGIWWGVSSATVSVSFLENNVLSGTHGTRTLFSIECENGKNICNYSYFQQEDEVVLMPGFYFKVTNALRAAEGVHVIYLKEINLPLS